MAFKSVLFQQKCVNCIYSCYIRYIRDIYPIKPLVSFLILSFNIRLMRILDHNTMTLKKLTDKFKTANTLTQNENFT